MKSVYLFILSCSLTFGLLIQGNADPTDYHNDMNSGGDASNLTAPGPGATLLTSATFSSTGQIDDTDDVYDMYRSSQGSETAAYIVVNSTEGAELEVSVYKPGSSTPRITNSSTDTVTFIAWFNQSTDYYIRVKAINTPTSHPYYYLTIIPAFYTSVTGPGWQQTFGMTPVSPPQSAPYGPTSFTASIDNNPNAYRSYAPVSPGTQFNVPMAPPGTVEIYLDGSPGHFLPGSVDTNGSITDGDNNFGYVVNASSDSMGATLSKDIKLLGQSINIVTVNASRDFSIGNLEVTGNFGPIPISYSNTGSFSLVPFGASVKSPSYHRAIGPIPINFDFTFGADLELSGTSQQGLSDLAHVDFAVKFNITASGSFALGLDNTGGKISTTTPMSLIKDAGENFRIMNEGEGWYQNQIAEAGVKGTLYYNPLEYKWNLNGRDEPVIWISGGGSGGKVSLYGRFLSLDQEMVVLEKVFTPGVTTKIMLSPDTPNVNVN